MTIGLISRKKLLKIISAAFFILIASQCFAQANFKFEDKVVKFEKTPAGQQLDFEYVFTNIGNEPLIINEIMVTCPCTKSVFPKEPILPNKTGKIKVTFDTANKIGYQDRTLEIYSNAIQSPTSIRFKGMVDHKHPQ